MDILYDRTVTCLVCKQTYTTKKSVRVSFVPSGTTLTFAHIMRAKKRIRFCIMYTFVHIADLRQQKNFQRIFHHKRLRPFNKTFAPIGVGKLQWGSYIC